VEITEKGVGALTIGKIKRTSLRDVWKHEALDFTTWLQENLDVINDALDISLSSAEREQSAGDFSVDLVAEDEDGNPVVIENQLEKSNHDHLGKLLTYLVARDAKAAIWIVSDPRPEHVKAITWLNESSSVSFYLVKIEAIKIEDSLPAPLLTLVVGPSEEAKGVGEKKKEWEEREIIRHRFWTELLDKAAKETDLYATVSASKGNWIATGAGKSGLRYKCSITKHSTTAELYIDRGKESGTQNEDIFDQLITFKEAIEDTFGEPLDWRRLEGNQHCRVGKQIDTGGYRDEDQWPAIHQAMIKAVIRLEKAFRPYIEQLKIPVVSASDRNLDPTTE
jgi:hypothetical protein